MSLLATTLRRLRALATRSRIDCDLEEEMRLHLELRGEQLRQRDGLSAEASMTAARRRFGNVRRLREESVASWGWQWLDQLAQDIRFAVRTLARNPGFSVTAILTLALGIGANTAIFSVLNGVVLKPLPYTNGERLVLFRQSAPGLGIANAGLSVREYYDYRDQAQSFDAVVEYHQMFFDLLRRGAPDRVDVGVVSHDFFDVLGIQPMLGRSFTRADDTAGADAVLILSYSYWMEKFGGDPAIVGQVFEMNDRPHAVIGVLPNVPHYPQENDVYMPVAACPFRAQAETAMLKDRRAFQLLNGFGRLKPGVTQAAAAKEIDGLGRRFTGEHPGVYPPKAGFAATAPTVRSELVRDAEPLLFLLLGTTALVLLIACANVANLAVARLLRRDRELGMREALGAGRARLIRQLLTESTLLSMVGGAMGLLFAVLTMPLLTTFVARFTSRTGEISIDGRVLAFTSAISVLTGVAFGAVPAVLSRIDLGPIMRAGRHVETRFRRRLQGGLVVAQVSVSVVLLAGAGLLLVSVYKLQQVDAGIDLDRVVSAEAYTTFARRPERPQFLAFYQSIVEALEAEPDVVTAAVASTVPLASLQPGTARYRIGRMPSGGDLSSAEVGVVTPGYFATLGIPVLDGRGIEDRDTADSVPVAVVNETLARQWGGRPIVGTRLTLGGQRWLTVVGVVGDVRQYGLDGGATAQVYVPLGQGPAINSHILMRTTGDPARAAATITRVVHALDPDTPVENISTLDALRSSQLRRPRLTAALLSIFAGLALVVTLTGLAGVMAMHVAHRVKEFGVRMALGASRQQVVRPVLRDGLRLLFGGLFVGVAASLGLTHVLSAYLFDTTPTDPVTFAAVIAALVVAGGAACLGPAWRATRVDPQVIFRTE